MKPAGDSPAAIGIVTERDGRESARVLAYGNENPPFSGPGDAEMQSDHRLNAVVQSCKTTLSSPL